MASPLPPLNGTLTFEPAFLIAFSSPTVPARTMVSAMVAPVFFAIPSKTFNVFDNLSGSLACQFFIGAKRILAPFAPPRLSVLR